jgi:hypothetical protein
MTSWKWLFALIAVFATLGLRTKGDQRAQRAALVAIVGLLAYETLKYHAY